MSIYKEITLIIVSYKSESLIQKNIDIIKKFQTIIVENSSSYRIDNLVNGCTNIKLLKPKKNLGYGSANNLAVSVSETPYVLIVNPDVYLEEKYIEELYKAYLRYKEKSGIVGPALYDKDFKRFSLNNNIDNIYLTVEILKFQNQNNIEMTGFFDNKTKEHLNC